jgi:hypothetical protein
VKALLALALLALALLSSAASCEHAREEPAWPAGTVLALGDRPIPASEVDEACASFALLEPQDSIDQLRRLALTNVVLPRCAAQAIDPDARRGARERAEAVQRALSANAPVQGAQAVERNGRMLDLGLELWFAARELPPGQWTDVVETPGCFQIARLLEKGSAPVPAGVPLTLEVYDFPYLPPEQARERIDAQLDRSHLVYVDETWRSLVPIAWQHRLKGGSP